MKTYRSFRLEIELGTMLPVSRERPKFHVHNRKTQLTCFCRLPKIWENANLQQDITVVLTDRHPLCLIGEEKKHGKDM